MGVIFTIKMSWVMCL